MKSVLRNHSRSINQTTSSVILFFLFFAAQIGVFTHVNADEDKRAFQTEAEKIDSLDDDAQKTVADLKALDFPILFVKQHNYQGLHIYDTFYQYRPGGGIYILENPSAPPEERRIRPVIDPTTPETLGEGVYFDPSLSYDAQKVLFCFKGSAQGNSTIYEIGVDGRGLRQLTNLDKGGAPYFGSGAGIHDVQPVYLPDGRIAFASTRYSGLVPCANNGVAILHVMNGDGSDIHTISVNNVTEFNPSVMDDGRILFGRWEYIDKNALTIQSLWTVLPDGTNETALFANNMVFPEAILQAKQVPDRPDLVVGTFAPHNAPPRGTIALVDVSGDKNDEGAIFNFEYPECPTFDRGQSCDPWPLNENVVLYSGMILPKLPTERPVNPASPERVGGVLPQNQGEYNALFLIDREGRRVEVLRDSAIDLHSPIPVRPRPIPRLSPESTDRSKTTGKFFVGNVYNGLDGVEPGTVKWLRVVEETSRVGASPGSNGLNQTFSISAALAWSAKIYHGIVPVREDGSVYFEAPSGRALYFQLLDEDYRLVRGMRTFIQAAPGATRSCSGCHEYGPPNLSEAGAVRYPKDAAEKLRDESWGSGYLDYVSKIQPIWNAKCVRCHGGRDGIAAGLDLSDGPTERFNISYDNLTSRRRNQYQIDLIAGVCCMNGTAYYSCKFFAPYEHGSGAAPLAELLLRDSIHRDLLTPKERELVFTWIDSNGLYFGTWNYTKSGPLLEPWNEAKRQLVQIMKESRCAECHSDETGAVRRFENDWINLSRPEASRILRAPLRKNADGENRTDANGLQLCRNRAFDQRFLRLGVMSGGQYEHSVKELKMFPTQEWRVWNEDGDPVCVFESADDPVYRRMLTVIQNAREKALSNPRIDMLDAGQSSGDVIVGRSRQILPQPLPDQEISFRAALASDGIVRLDWESSARTIGLVFEIHRSQTPNFVPNAQTLLAETELFAFEDKTVGPGRHYYALVPISDPLETCGTCVAFENQTETATCPLSDFIPKKAAPIYREVEVGAISPPNPPTGVATVCKIEKVEIRWNAPFSAAPDATTQYQVYRSEPTDETAPTKDVCLTSAPIYAQTFVDATGIPGVEYSYYITSVSRRGDESEPSERVAGASFPEAKMDWFVASFQDDFVGSTPEASNDGAPVSENDASTSETLRREVAPKLLGEPRIADRALSLSDAALIFPGRSEYNAGRKFSLEADVYFESADEMPVVVSFGNWNRAGWFLQKLNGKWRFHLGGLDCDAATETPLREWLHLTATFDGEKLVLTQNGKTIAERSGTPFSTPWNGDLYVGQYSAAPGNAYRFSGQIRNLQIRNYIPR